MTKQEPKKQTLGELIREKRLAQRPKLSMRALADRMGITASFICDIENGRRRPSDDVLRSFCNELGIGFTSVFRAKLRDELQQVITRATRKLKDVDHVSPRRKRAARK